MDSEQYLVVVPKAWRLEEHAIKNRRHPNVQDFIRELIRRDLQEYEKEKVRKK